MSLKIYTYSNPYEIENESFWDSIRNYPHFCVSQTLVNGMKTVSTGLSSNKNICTIRKFVNKLYSNWDDVSTKVRQMVEVDNAISFLNFHDLHADSLKKSLLNNTKSITNSIRIFSTLNLNPYDFSTANINVDQNYLIEIYKRIYDDKNSNFKFKRVNDEKEIDIAIEEALKEANSREHEFDLSKIDKSAIVINGIHQFSPDIICAIEDLSKFKDVILIFNYQKQYYEIYETWLRVYSIFNQPIKFSSIGEFTPYPFESSYKTNLLADSMGKLVNCDYSDFNQELNTIEVTEFENITEFANYVAKLYDKALIKKNGIHDNKSPLYYMDEQFYSASTKVNDILRAYFPNQFGERHFLDYPLGHFFVATMNMWDSENNCVVVNSFSDVKECINAGILKESRHGLLINSFNIVLPFIEDLSNYDEIIIKLQNLSKYVSIQSEEKKKIGYFNISYSDLFELINALKDLKQIILSFFEDFKNGNDNFKKFYDRVKRFIQNKVDDTSDFDKEMIEVMKQLLIRMENSDIPNECSFITLKQTMSFYLNQDEYINSSAKWIVRGFEQIDGDILLSGKSAERNIDYHFCCLSDKDICASKDERLPWPLDVSFFKFIQIPLDWKYQLFLKSKSEYHNFNRYALLYGLVFSRCKCKLSFVKTENNKNNELYHIFSMLGIKVKKYNSYDISGFSNRLTIPSNNAIDLDSYIDSLNDIDKFKISICPYKFCAESIIQNHTIFRDRFLIHNFMRILIRNSTLEELQGQVFDSKVTQNKINEKFDFYQNKFRIATDLEKAQLLAQVYKDVTNNYYVKYNKFILLSVHEKEKMKFEEDFLLTNPLNDKNLKFLKDFDIKEIIDNGYLNYKKGKYCKYCASKDICLESKN